MRGAVAVTGFIGQRRSDDVISGSQRIHVCRRHPHDPVARSIQGRGVIFIVDGDGHHIARCRACHGTGDNQRLRMFSTVDHVVVRNGIDGQFRHCGIDQHIAIRRGLVARFIGNRRGDGVVAVNNRAEIRRRYGHAPATVCLYGGGVILAVQDHGHGLPGFGVGHAAHDQIDLRFCRIDDVVIANDLDRHRRRGRIHTVLTTGGSVVAVHVGHAYLHAGITVFQAAQICRRYGCRPVTAGIYTCSVRFAAKGDIDGLVLLHVGR